MGGGRVGEGVFNVCVLGARADWWRRNESRHPSTRVLLSRCEKTGAKRRGSGGRRRRRSTSRERKGEIRDREAHVQGGRGTDGQERTEQEEGGRVKTKSVQKQNKERERERTTQCDGQMREAALRSLSSHSVLLSIREERTPLQYPRTPSVTECVSAHERVRDLIGAAWP